MRSILMATAFFAVALIAGGCQTQEQQATMVAEEPVESAPVAPLPSDRLTLSSEQLALLDWCRPSLARPRVVDQRVLDEGGVEFDIRFPGNGPVARSIDYLSSGSGGHGALIGLDVEGYKTFALKFTLVAIDGEATPGLPQELEVGAVVGPTGDGQLSGYEPLSLGLASQPKSGVAETPLGMKRIRQIGIHADLANPEKWNEGATLVTLRVEPVADASVAAIAPMIIDKSPRQKRLRQRRTDSPNMGPGRLGAW
jgi:hypothetical protein